MWQWYVAEYGVFFKNLHREISHCETFPILKGASADADAYRHAMAILDLVCQPTYVIDPYPVKSVLREVHRLGPAVNATVLLI